MKIKQYALLGGVMLVVMVVAILVAQQAQDKIDAKKAK